MARTITFTAVKGDIVKGVQTFKISRVLTDTNGNTSTSQIDNIEVRTEADVLNQVEMAQAKLAAIQAVK